MSIKFKRSFWVTLLVVTCLSLGFTGGLWAHSLLVIGNTEHPLLEQATTILRDHGLKEIPEGKVMEYGMIRGMLQAYDDPYTIFVEPVQHELETNTLEGKFGGIGVRISRDEGGFVRLYPLPGGPAAVAGILEGDRLLSVEGISIGNQTSDEEIQAALRGPVGSRVNVSVGRLPDFTPLEVTIKRAEFALPSVTWNLYPDDLRLGVIKVNVIAASTPDEVVKAIDDLKQRGAEAFALDLRDNFGGLLDAGVNIARLFLADGVVIEQQYRGRQIESFEVERKGKFADLPLAIVVNQHTASAAEVVAGALQQHDRGLLIGSSTYGKDTIQLVFNLDDGSSLHVTSARWWIPGLQPPLGENGLQPQIVISPPAEPIGFDAALGAAADTLLNR